MVSEPQWISCIKITHGLSTDKIARRVMLGRIEFMHLIHVDHTYRYAHKVNPAKILYAIIIISRIFMADFLCDIAVAPLTVVHIVLEWLSQGT
jgi:hypothetical protein